MLSNIFQAILIQLKAETDVDSNKLERLLEYIQKKDIGTYVYPEKIEEKFLIESKDVSNILVILEKKNIVKQVYKLYCPSCRDFSSEIYDTINQLEEHAYCEWCDKELIDKENLFKFVAIYFKVINNAE